ncbi:SURF1 family protein [soil metagenome]
MGSLLAVYRFVLRPSWIVSHVLVVALVVVMVSLGFWQLRRLDERQAANALIEGRADQPESPVADVVSADDSTVDADAVLYRRVSATGSYAAGDEVLVRSRSMDGAPGSWVLTPLLLDDGTAVVVNRGWIPNDGTRERAPAEAAPPEDEVRVSGLLYPSQTRGDFGPTDPADGRLATLARADLGRLQQQVAPDLFPAYVQLTASAPPGGDLPRPLGPPELDDGPHFGYAVQWFIFSAIALGGYPLILRRTARERHDDAADPRDRLEPDDPRLDPVPGRDQPPA